MISEYLLFVHAVWAGSMPTKLTELRFLGWKILFTGVTLWRLNLLSIRLCNGENLISHVELYPFVSYVNLVSLVLNLIHHCSRW